MIDERGQFRLLARTEVERLDAARAPRAERVEMDGDEDVAPLLVGRCRSLLERQGLIAIAGEHGVEAVLQQEVLGPDREIERDILLDEPARTLRSDVLPAVTGVQNHAAHPKCQRPRPQRSGEERNVGGRRRCGLGRYCRRGRARGRLCQRSRLHGRHRPTGHQHQPDHDGHGQHQQPRVTGPHDEEPTFGAETKRQPTLHGLLVVLDGCPDDLRLQAG